MLIVSSIVRLQDLCLFDPHAEPFLTFRQDPNFMYDNGVKQALAYLSTGNLPWMFAWRKWRSIKSRAHPFYLLNEKKRQRLRSLGLLKKGFNTVRHHEAVGTQYFEVMTMASAYEEPEVCTRITKKRRRRGFRWTKRKTRSTSAIDSCSQLESDSSMLSALGAARTKDTLLENMLRGDACCWDLLFRKDLNPETKKDLYKKGSLRLTNLCNTYAIIKEEVKALSRESKRRKI